MEITLKVLLSLISLIFFEFIIPTMLGLLNLESTINYNSSFLGLNLIYAAICIFVTYILPLLDHFLKMPKLFRIINETKTFLEGLLPQGFVNNDIKELKKKLTAFIFMYASALITYLYSTVLKKQLQEIKNEIDIYVQVSKGKIQTTRTSN